MPIRTFILNKTFKSGMAVQKVCSTLASMGAGELTITKMGEETVEVEVDVYNPLWMSWVEDHFADFV
jgi:hypothetical protein